MFNLTDDNPDKTTGHHVTCDLSFAEGNISGNHEG